MFNVIQSVYHGWNQFGIQGSTFIDAIIMQIQSDNIHWALILKHLKSQN